MSQIAPLSFSMRTETLATRPTQPKAETAAAIAERTQALAKQLDEQLSNRLFGIREATKAINPPHVGSLVDIDA